MASCKVPLSMEVIDNCLKCGICEDSGSMTYLLTCFHPICKPCINGDNITGGQLACKKCQYVTHFGNQGNHIGPKKLTENYFAALWHFYDQFFQASQECVMCKSKGNNVRATHLCVDCGSEDFLCGECLPSHTALSITRHHTPIHLANIYDADCLARLKCLKNTFCHQQQGEHTCHSNPKTHCIQCHGQATEAMARFSIKHRQDIEKLQNNLFQYNNYACQCTRDLESLVQQTVQTHDTAVDGIEQGVAALKEWLDLWKDAKLQALDEFKGKGMQILDDQLQMWRTLAASTSNAQVFSSLYLQHASDVDLYADQAALVNGLTLMISQVAEASKTTPPFAPPALHFRWNDIVQVKHTLEGIMGTLEQVQLGTSPKVAVKQQHGVRRSYVD